MSKISKAMKDELEKEVVQVVMRATRNTSLNAKSFAPVDKGGLRASIRPLYKGKSGEVTVGVEYAPYVEFGTGSKVNVPSELSSYAVQFKGAGLRESNTRAQPYFYPAVFLNREKFYKEMDKSLNNIIKKRR
jgi:HK97 gp10 family phage protein